MLLLAPSGIPPGIAILSRAGKVYSVKPIMEDTSRDIPKVEYEDPAEEITGPNCWNSRPDLQDFDWWSEWQAVVGKEQLPDEPTEAEFSAWLEYRRVQRC
jgi:hypothetical protein